MGNVLKQAQQRHTDLRSGRYMYNPGSFWDVVYSDTAMRRTNLHFDMSTANPDDALLSTQEYRDLLPNIRSITLKSEPNVPSLYNITPNVLIAHAPHLTYLDIAHVNHFDLPVIEGLFPHLQYATVRLHLDQFQRLSERNPSVFQMVSALMVYVPHNDRITSDSWWLLREWAYSHDLLALKLHVQKWTASLQIMLSELSASVHPHIYGTNGLDMFQLTLDEIDDRVVEPNFDVWNCFISNTTKVQIIIKYVYNITQSTMTWLDATLNNFMKNHSDVLICMTLHCVVCDWKELIDPLLRHYVEHVRDAYLKANNLQVLPAELVDDCAKRTLLKLKITLNVENPIPHRNTNQNTRNPFADNDPVRAALFIQSHLSIDVTERLKPTYEEPPTKIQKHNG